MFRSATFRVTLVTVVVTMVISAIFSLTIYHFADGAIQFSAERQYDRFRRLYAQPPSRTALVKPMGEEQAQAARNLLLNLIYLNLVILGVSTLVGAYLAKRTLEPIEQAMELQGQFTADASHELRTPLAAMRSEIEVTLRDKKISEADARQLLSSNLEEIAKLEGLASGLLQLARLESASLQFESVAIAAPIKNAIASLKQPAKQNQIKVSYQGANFKVLGEPDSLAQLFKILLDNAIKYGKKNGRVDVSTKTSGHRGIIMVADDGPGIDPVDLPHVFERFWRATDSRTKHKADGYGLGLAIASEITQLHKGEIKVDSSASQGTCFSIELPLI